MIDKEFREKVEHIKDCIRHHASSAGFAGLEFEVALWDLMRESIVARSPSETALDENMCEALATIEAMFDAGALDRLFEIRGSDVTRH